MRINTKRTLSILSAISIVVWVFCSVTLGVKAHPGRTDGKGGHTNHSTGEYHYHHGYSAHDHYDMDGDSVEDCPYNFDDKTNHSSSNRSGVTSNSGAKVESVPPKSNAESNKKSFSDIIFAILEHLLIAIAIWLFSSYFLSYIFLFIFGEEFGCSISMIAGAVISIGFTIWLIISWLSET